MLVTFHSRDHYNSPTSCCSLNAHVELALERRERHVKATNRLTEARSVPANWMSQGSGRSGRIIQLPFVYHCKPEPSARMNDHSVVFVPCALASPGLPRPPGFCCSFCLQPRTVSPGQSNPMLSNLSFLPSQAFVQQNNPCVQHAAREEFSNMPNPAP